MLCENIKNLRQAKGLTQEELAVRLHVVRQTVSKWEKGLSVPDAELLIALARELDTTVGFLLGESDPPAEEETELSRLSQKLEELNAVLAEKTAQSRRRARIAAVFMLISAGLWLLILLIPATQFLTWQLEMNAVGAIGGADGPTAIFITGGEYNLPMILISAFGIIALAAAAIVLLRKNRR